MTLKKYPNSIELGEKIRKLRQDVGEKFSQEEVAKLIGISRSSLANIESGRSPSIKVETLRKIADLYEYPLGYFVEEENIFSDIDSDDEYYVFKKILLYILNRVGDKANFGKKVLFKLLYFSEFNYYEKYGKSLLNIEFKKLPMGPVPNTAQTDVIFHNMQALNQLSLMLTRYKGFEQQRYISGIKDIDTLSLAQDDVIGLNAVRVVDDVIEKLSHMNGNEISEYSHGDMPYIATRNIGDIIDKNLVFYRSEKYEYVTESEDDF